MTVDDVTPIEAEIRRLIAIAGPMPVSEFMALCLSHPKHGYYVTRDPLGSAGDFTTAPEISQMFGELIGLWAASVWRLMGSPEHLSLIELGPGRATMMADALRAARVVPDFRNALAIHLVETSPTLQNRQRQTLARTDVPVLWHQTLSEVPDGPMVILANEFFDALPVGQAVKQAGGWHERVVDVDEAGNLTFGIAREPMRFFEQTLPPKVRAAEIGAIFEWRSDHIVLELGRRVVRGGGAALIIDYGHVESAVGDTFQAMRSHHAANPLTAPGQADLTAHVDFQALGVAAESIGANLHGPLTQAEFLYRLGIEERAAVLRRSAPPDRRGEIDSALARLTDTGLREMGSLFKVIGLSAPHLNVLPGFE